MHTVRFHLYKILESENFSVVIEAAQWLIEYEVTVTSSR